jgi:L-alanine-DL-glutamate epimerase-like enolase superfamily enzyme
VRIKIDVDPAGWSAAVWRSLAETRRVVVVDFKLQGDVREVALVHRWMPGAWIEDPPPAALDPAAPWRRRVALDSYVSRAADLVPPPVAPGAVNVKAARVGGPLEALRILEVCFGAGWAAYTGGMFEAGPGRLQARVLASLYTPDAWNDLAPLAPEHGAATERLELSLDFRGFAPRA